MVPSWRGQLRITLETAQRAILCLCICMTEEQFAIACRALLMSAWMLGSTQPNQARREAFQQIAATLNRIIDEADDLALASK